MGIMFLILIIISLFSFKAESKTLKIAVIDSGFDFKSTWPNAAKNKLTYPKLCKTGHYDFVNGSKKIEDKYGHGTHIAGLIAKGNERVDYCLVILKVFEPKHPLNGDSEIILRAFAVAYKLKVDMINFSGGGVRRYNKECLLMKFLLNKGIQINAAAGNESSDLSKSPYYPAMCDNRINKIVNIDKEGNLGTSSNYDKSRKIANVEKEIGVNVMSLMPNNTYGINTGTSQATAVYTSKQIRILNGR